MPSSIVVTVRAHWFNAWFLRLLSRPVVLVDDAEHPVGWGEAKETIVAPGDHTVAAGVRYRGSGTLLGAQPVGVSVADGQSVRLVARNGLFNHQPFTLAARTSGERPA